VASDDEVLFRLRGTPVYRGGLVLFQEDPDVFPDPRPEPVVCVVIDFAWDDDCMMHLVHVLLNGKVTVVHRGDLTPI
jgi:hypothetical protein